MSKLYNFSQYATAHAPTQGQKPTGYTLTGYRYDDENEKTYYCNLYIPADRVKIKRDPHGGGWYMTIAMQQITPKYKDENDIQKQQRKTSNLKNGKRPSDDLQSFDNDPDIPF